MSQIDNSIEPMQIDDEDVGAFIDLLTQDLTREQFLREFTQNAIEAMNPQTGGTVTWMNDPVSEEIYDAPKLSVVDNGAGMSSAELLRFINKLGKSGKTRNTHANFGIGAKVSSLPFNPFGVVFQSWKDGIGSQITVIETDEGHYGVKRINGNAIENINLSHRPQLRGVPLIKEHGTQVTLLGHASDENTMLPPEGVLGSTAWLHHNLNRRYFVLPSHIAIQAPVLKNMISGEEASHMAVNGQKHFLERNSIHSGVVPLSTSQVHWWIIKKPSGAWNYYERIGHIAALFQNELYDWTSAGSKRNARMMSFGIHTNKEQVVLYVEPRSNMLDVQSKPSRKSLLVDGDDFPWSEIGAEFYSNMPPILKQFIEKDLDHATSESLDKIRKAQEKRIRARQTNFPKYVASKTGSETSELEKTDAHSVANLEGEPNVPPQPRRIRNVDGPQSTTRNVSPTPSPNAIPAKKINEWDNPKIIWMSTTNGTRSKDDLEDRFGRYVEGTHILYLNEDFRIFQDWLNNQYKLRGAEHNPEIKQIIKRTTQTLFETMVVDHIAGAIFLRGSKEWTDYQIDSVLHEEAISHILMQEAVIQRRLNFEVGNELSNRPITEVTRSAEEIALGKRRQEIFLSEVKKTMPALFDSSGNLKELDQHEKEEN